MNKKIVYFLGAGFSAPLGLPVMSNFLERAKDIYFSDRINHAHFQDVFKTINAMSVAKNYYHTDLFNIEEILSVLVMQDYLEGKSRAPDFQKFIGDTIQHFTPPVEPYGQLPSNWSDFVLGTSKLWNLYAPFALSLLGLSIRRSNNGIPIYNAHPKPPAQYSVITLNYDLVFETIIDHVRSKFDPGIQIRITSDDSEISEPDTYSLPVIKLHGSVDPLTIVPPTWNKTLSGPVTSSWQCAHRLLAEANEIRILGYSLPESDSYIKYLFISSALQSEHLKKIDVITLDSDNSTFNRYAKLISFPNLKLESMDISRYLRTVQEKTNTMTRANSGNPNYVWLEEAHEMMMRRAKE